MARSIADWFDDRADGSLGDRMDDETVEKQAPWDLAESGMSTRRGDRKALSIGAGRSGPPQRSGQQAGKPSAQASRATQAGRRQHPGQVDSAASLEARVRQAAKDHPDFGHKRIARLLRDGGTNVTRAQVAQLLARPNAIWRREPSRRTPRSANVFRVRADAQQSRVVPTTELCTSCGVRLTVIGTCRCS